MVLTLLGLVLALGDGGYVYTLLHKALPALGVMRMPMKFVILTTLRFHCSRLLRLRA